MTKDDIDEKFVNALGQAFKMIEPSSNVIQVDFTNKCKRKPVYPVLVKPLIGEEQQD